MDANREYDQGTFRNPIAGKAYKEYQGFIEKAKKSIKKGNGLIFDIHGQTHKEGWVELGYLVSTWRLNKDVPLAKYSSIKSLAERSSSTFKSILRGRKSLGYFLQKQLIKTIPSPAHLRPGKGGYFNGGYNIKRHGSLRGGNIDGIQIEIPRRYRNKDTAQSFTISLAKAIHMFALENNYYQVCPL